MFTTNESMLDRVIRFLVGALLIYAWYAMLVTGAVATIALVVGLVLALTGVIGWCPIYSLFHMGTHKSSV